MPKEKQQNNIVTTKQTTIVGAVIIILVLGYLFLFPLLFPQGFRGELCSKEDSFVKGTAKSMQEYYAQNGEFPSINAIANTNNRDETIKLLFSNLNNEYDIDSFSNAGPEEFFVYFESNCKLQITPDSYEVYSKK